MSVSKNFTTHDWQLVWYAVILVLGVIGNTSVMIILVCSKNIQKSSPFNVFLFSLTISDLMISIVGLPTYVLSTDTYKHPEGIPGDYLCKFITGFTLLFFFSGMSTFLMVVIYVERWKVIRKPFSVLDSKPLWKSVVVIVLVVLINFGLAVPTVKGIVYNSNRPAGGNFCGNSYTPKESLMIYLSLFVFDTVIPISIIVTLWVRIAMYLRKTKEELGNMCQDHTKATNKSVLGDRVKTIHTLMLVVLAFLFCVVPNRIIFLLSLTGSIHWNTTISQVAVLLRFSSSIVNPFLYSFSSQSFRNHYKGVFKCCFSSRNKKLRQTHRQPIAYYKYDGKHTSGHNQRGNNSKGITVTT